MQPVTGYPNCLQSTTSQFEDKSNYFAVCPVSSSMHYFPSLLCPFAVRKSFSISFPKLLQSINADCTYQVLLSRISSFATVSPVKCLKKCPLPAHCFHAKVRLLPKSCQVTTDWKHQSLNIKIELIYFAEKKKEETNIKIQSNYILLIEEISYTMSFLIFSFRKKKKPCNCQ